MKKLPKEQIEKQYHEELVTHKELAEFHNVDISTVERLFKKNNIETRENSKTEKHRKRLKDSKLGRKNPNFGKRNKNHGKRHWIKSPNGDTVSMRSTWEVSYAASVSKILGRN